MSKIEKDSNNGVKDVEQLEPHTAGRNQQEYSLAIPYKVKNTLILKPRHPLVFT